MGIINVEMRRAAFGGLTSQSESLWDECTDGWQTMKKSEMLAERMCRWLADNEKISLKRELINASVLFLSFLLQK